MLEITDDVIIPSNLGAKNPRNWKRRDVKEYLEANKDKFDLDQKHITTLYSNDVSGRVFLKLTEERLITHYKMSLGAATAIEELVDALKQPPQQPPQGKFSLTIMQYFMLIIYLTFHRNNHVQSNRETEKINLLMVRQY